MTCKIANDERLAKKVTTASGSKMYYFHPDHLGSTSVVSNEDGQLVEKTEYYPYGSVKQGGSEQYLFTGKELDRGTGLYYYGARYYSPELMRFTQPDSIIPDAYDPQSLNRYAYVRNNPLKYVDPSGNLYKKGAASGGVMIAMGAALAIFATGPVGIAVGIYIAAAGGATGFASLLLPEEAGPAVDLTQEVTAIPIASGLVLAEEVFRTNNIEEARENTRTFNNAIQFGTSTSSLIRNPKSTKSVLDIFNIYVSGSGLLGSSDSDGDKKIEDSKFKSSYLSPTPYYYSSGSRSSGSSGGWGGGGGWYRGSTSPSGSTGSLMDMNHRIQEQDMTMTEGKL